MRPSPGSPTTRDVSPGDRTTERSASRAWASLGLVAGLTVLTFQSLRVLFPLAYNFGERRSFTSAGMVALALFAVPAASSVIRRLLGPRGSLLAATVILAATRLAVPLVRPVPLWLAAVASVTALVALALAYTALRARGGEGGREIMVGLLVGMAIDTAVVTAFRTWEPSWQQGVMPRLVAVGTAVSAVAFAKAVRLPGGEVRAGVWSTAAVGPFLMLHVLFLQNLAFTGSAADTHLPAASALVLGGDVLALVAMASASRLTRGWGARLAIGAALVVLAALVNEVEGVAAMVVFLLAAPAAALALATALGRDGRPGAWRAGVGMGLASVAFLLLTLLFYLHYDVPLPFPNVALAPIAAALLAGAAIPEPSSEGWGRMSAAIVPAALLVVPAAMAVLAPAPVAGSPTVRSIRVVNYNVHTTVNVDGQLDPEAVARVIEAQRPDVVVLQEVSRGWGVAGTIDSAEWLSDRLGLPYIYVSAADRGFGNAIFSRLPFLDTDEGLLPKVAGPMERAWIRAVLNLGDGRSFTVIGTHLHHQHDGPEDDRTRLSQIGVLLKVWGGASRTIIAGDMNATPDSDEFARFEAAGLHSAGDPSIPTSPSTDPRNRIDYIFATPDLAFSDVVIPQSTASDHLAVAATVGFSSGF